MDLLDRFKFLDAHFNGEETKHDITELRNEVMKYDIYDVIARISALNLIPENQNKAVLFDSLIEYILREDATLYQSKYKMSPGKFKKLIQQLDECNLAHSIDPNENVFVQRIMCNENYVVFNGIDQTPAYNLQMMIYTLFVVKNNLPGKFLRKCGKLVQFILHISDYVATSIGIGDEIYDVLPQEVSKIVVPDSEKVNEYAKKMCFDTKWIKTALDDEELYKDLFAEFGTRFSDDMGNRSFYSCPFVINEENEQGVLLNVSLLPNFAFYEIIELASRNGVKEELMNLYNDYVFRDCRKSLDALGHKKIKESLMGITLKNETFYKEVILNVFNDQLMILSFICDDAQDYNRYTMHNNYPNSKHADVFQNRMLYLRDSLIKAGVQENNIFGIVIINAYGRGIGVSLKEDVFPKPILSFSPFELRCVSINERKYTDFLPRYIKVKSKLNVMMDHMLSELNAIEIFTSNNYSFYLGDDINPRKTSLFIAPGDSTQYILRALKREGRKLVDSYDEDRYSEVVLLDVARQIYFEEGFRNYRKIAFYVPDDKVDIWIVSEEPHKEEEINIYYSIVDFISYWLSESREVWSRIARGERRINISVTLQGELIDFYYEKQDSDSFEDGLEIEIIDSQIVMSWKPAAYRMMAGRDNAAEKWLMTIIIKMIFKALKEAYLCDDELNVIFANPLKKKFFVLDYQKKPYYKPVIDRKNRCIHVEDEEYLSDIIGEMMLQEGKWTYGVISGEDRSCFANEVVGKLYALLQEKVAQLNPFHLVEAIYDDLEIVLYNLMLAGKRYAWDIACYPEKENEFLQDYNTLNKTSLALKFLMEYVAACPPDGDKTVGIGEYEYILAICSMIVDWAYKNDLFFYHIFDTPVEILQSNRIGMKHHEFDVMFSQGDQYRRQQLYYNSSSILRKVYGKTEIDYSERIDEGFKEEYGYTYRDLYMMIMSMVELGEKANASNVKVFKEEDLIAQLSQMNPDLNISDMGKMLEQISLSEREDYLVPPKPYRREDVYPWRFNREYSFNRRPVVKRGKEIIWGNRQLYHMLEFLLDLVYDGKLKTRKKKLEAVIGNINNERGHEFNQLIYNMLNDMNAFKLYPNVKKINGKAVSNEDGGTLGDIDILVVDEQYHRIYVSEVKDFNFSRNPYEMHLEYQKMFVDTKKERCFATKHSRRVEWLRNHIEDVKEYYKLNKDSLWDVVGIFIVSEPLLSNEVYHKGLNIISRAELNVEKIRSIRK